MTFPNYIFSAFSFLGFLMCAIPLPWHLQAWNAGTCLYMIWVGLACLNQFVNSVVWNRDVINRSPIWCDISTKFIIGVNTAVAACSLCINRRLYLIASAQQIAVTRVEKRRELYVDLAIGLGIPVVAMILHYIVQGHRFDIYEQIGCWPSVYFTPPAIVLVSLPPIILGLAAAIYSYFTVKAFQRARSRLASAMEYRNITYTRYIRHTALAACQIIGTVPISCLILGLQIATGISPWISWEDTHSNFARVDQYPVNLWRSGLSGKSLEFGRWLNVLCAFTFFAFFGFAAEAKRKYRTAYNSIASVVGLTLLPNYRDRESNTYPESSRMRVTVTLSVLDISPGNSPTDIIPISFSQSKNGALFDEERDIAKLRYVSDVLPLEPVRRKS